MLFRFAWVFIFPEALQRHLHSALKNNVMFPAKNSHREISIFEVY